MEDIDEKMIELWQKGHTAKHIANELGLTRNTIAGKLYRFKLSGRIDKKNIDERLSNIKEQSRKVNASRSPELAKQKTPEVSLYKIEDKLIPLAKINTDFIGTPVNFVLHKEEPAPVGKPLRFEQLTSRSCRYIINNGDAKDFLFCGQTKERGSYCEEHAKLCYYTIVRTNRNESKTQSS
jgi:hypothetical protein